MAGGEHFAGHRLVQDPVQRRIAGRAQEAGDAGPVQVHVDGHGRSWSAVREALLLLAQIGQRQARSAEIARHQYVEVPGGAECLEIFEEESILAVVRGGAFAARLDQFVTQDGRWWRCCRHAETLGPGRVFDHPQF